MGRSYKRRIAEKRWFHALLGGLAILTVAFTILPNLADWMSPTSTRSPALETTSSVPAEGATPPAPSPPISERGLAWATPQAKVTAQAERKSREPHPRKTEALAVLLFLIAARKPPGPTS